MVGVLSGASLIKGLAACGLGLIVGSIGDAPATGEFRMTLGIDYLYDGLPLVIVGIGLFAFPEITELLRRNRAIASARLLAGDWLEGIRDVFRHWFLCLRCAGIGTLIGAIPGLGGTVVDWIAYGHVVQTAKDKSRFGKGDIRGVLAPESATTPRKAADWCRRCSSASPAPAPWPYFSAAWCCWESKPDRPWSPAIST